MTKPVNPGAPTCALTIDAAALLTAMLDAIGSDPSLAARVRSVCDATLQSDTPVPLAATGQSVRAQRKAIASGELPAVKIGREYRVRPSDVDAWLSARTVKPRSAEPATPAQRAIARAQRGGHLRAVGGRAS